MHILVTGAAGFIGSHLCEALLQDGVSVTGIDNYDPYYDVSIKEDNSKRLSNYPAFTLVNGDLLDPSTLEEAGKRQTPDMIIHLAARAGVRPSLEKPLAYAETNIQGTLAVFEFARKHTIRRVMIASSSSVYGNREDAAFSEDDELNPFSPYAASKAACEIFAKTYTQLYDMDITAFRFFTVYGERGRPDMAPFIFTKAIVNGTSFTKFGTGETKRDYTHVADIVQGIVAAAHTSLPGFQAFNLGNNQPISLNEFIAAIEKATGNTAIVDQRDTFLGDVTYTCANIDKAHQAFGYTPHISLEEGIRRLVSWYREEYATSQTQGRSQSSSTLAQ